MLDDSGDLFFAPPGEEDDASVRRPVVFRGALLKPRSVAPYWSREVGCREIVEDATAEAEKIKADASTEAAKPSTK